MLNWSERGHVLATCDESVVYCQVVGVGNMNNCAPFQEFTSRMQRQGYGEFILDFSGCQGLDSTFLGLVLGLSLGGKDRPARVTAVNVSGPIGKTFSEIGIDRLIEIIPDRVDLPRIPMQRLEADISPESRIEMILSAHETLCEVDADNRRRFGDFVAMLRGEQDRAVSGSRPPRRGAEGEDREGG